MTFREAVRPGRPIGLAAAALLYAREIAYPHLSPSAYLSRLEAMAQAVRPRLGARADPRRQVQALNDFLFGAVGLQGNCAEYDDPRNSFLNEVIDRRLGLPITLSVIYMEVAQRAGVPVEGVGLPGHFIVRGPGRLLVDPFNQGRLLSLTDCADLVRNTLGHTGDFDPAWLTPTPSRAILVRMLNNLRTAYVRREAWAQALPVMGCLRSLEPGEPTHVRDLGLLLVRTGQPRRAVRVLDEYLLRRPQAPDFQLLRGTVQALARELGQLN